MSIRTESYYHIWQNKRYGNVIGPNGTLHQLSETHHMVDDEIVLIVPEEFENGQREADEFAGKMDDYFQNTLNDCY